MSPAPQCTALASAMKTKGMNYKDIAEKMGRDETYVEAVCTGGVRPTAVDFNALAQVLDITIAPPHDKAHLTV